MTDPTPLLVARGLTRTWPEGRGVRTVLQSVDLCVPEGRFVTVMGPSGSGKSTLLHLLCGLDRPTEGTVELAGQELTRLSDEACTLVRRSQVGFVFQFFNLVPQLTVAENIGLPLLLQGVREPRQDERFQACAAFFGLADKLDRRPHELSGGEMQRTSLARALVHRPRVVLADEPTGNLSQGAGREVISYLRRAVDEWNQTVLLVTHNPRDARASDELHFLRDGRIESTSSLRGDQVHEDRIAACMEELGI